MLQDLCITLWPTEALPASFFGLLARLQEVVPQVDCSKRSACLEGAHRAYVCVKTHFQKVDAEVIVAGPHKGKVRTVEQFFVEVEEGAWMTEANYPKGTLYF